MANLTVLSRRLFLRNSTATILARTHVFESLTAAGQTSLHDADIGSAGLRLSLDRDWLFGGKLQQTALARDFQFPTFKRVTLPHTVVPLSWQQWDPDTWQDRWVYRRHFELPPQFRGMRLFLVFERVMASASLMLNGNLLSQHDGGFLPFECEITGLVQQDRDNVLALAVDCRWLDIPPAGSAKGPGSIDYLLPGGITGSVHMCAVPKVFCRDVFAKPVDVLSTARRVEVTFTIDSALDHPSIVHSAVTLTDGDRLIAHAQAPVKLERSSQQAQVSIGDLGNIRLWDVDNPHLYTVRITLTSGSKSLHTTTTRIGFREARFNTDGFFLNGQRLRLFGLNRHELFPYLGFSAPRRLQSRDAYLLRHDLNCNIVRCSHYPQSEAFLDACDELGLMVWEEIPGWQYMGDDAWKQRAVGDVEGMVRRDRNHPSIVVWGTRVNESPNDPELYERMRTTASSLDDSRPTSGSMTSETAKEWKTSWHEDVFALDDYHADPDGTVGISPPLPGVPYMLAEAVGQFNYANGRSFNARYRRAGDVTVQMQQALRHAQAHDRAAAYPRMAGVIAWCAFDYASLINSEAGVKCPGVSDVFRIPKLGAAFYQSQCDPNQRPVIEPGFYWDFGPRSPDGPGDKAPIFSNCERLELFVGGKPHSSLKPDRATSPNLKYPPFFAELGSVRAAGLVSSELLADFRIDGYVKDKKVLSRSFSADHSTDHLWLFAGETHLNADGSDMTRIAFGIVDKFGVFRFSAGGVVHLTMEGPGEFIGDNPFKLDASGGVGAIYLRTLPGWAGIVRIQAKHSLPDATSLGTSYLEVRVS